MNCGAGLDGTAPAPEVQAAEPPDERRQVTVLFADLSGYTAVAEQMDPEAVKSLVDRSLLRLGAEVESFGGTVDKYIGDNVMALFGAPVAHEDDAERAVRAALGMQQAMEEINGWLPGDVTLALRVGVNTGEVMAGAVGERYTVTGDTVNVASRLQSAGRPGTVTVGARTVQATRHAVGYHELAPLTLKGKANPVAAWEATGVTAAQSLRRAALPGSPLLGRDRELEVLAGDVGRVVREGRAHMVTLVGEAGVGKSRLLRELEQRLPEIEPDARIRIGRCLPYGSGIGYWALGEVMRGEAGIVDSDSSDEAWAKLGAYVSDVLAEEADVAERRAAQIGGSLGLDVPEALAQPETDPQRRRETFFSALRMVLESSAQRSPLVLAFEDIHWADDGMLDAIEHLARWVRAPLLVVCLARDELLERRSGWGGGRIGATQLFLEPLSAASARELVTALMGGQGSPSSDLAPLLAERSGGNPLFAEEMVRRLGDDGAEGIAELPDSVQAVLAARLDALDPFERRLVQQAAVVGQTFWEGSLRAVAEEEGLPLAPALSALQEKDILAPEPESRLAGERELAFKHVLVRDVAYGMLPKASRWRRHFEVGRFIEERAGDRADEVVALLADHYGRAAALGAEAGAGPADLAEVTERAVRFLEEAGDAAARLYANREAIAHLARARDLVRDTDPEAAARIGEKQGDVDLRMGRADAALEVWGECLTHHTGQENTERMADLHRKLGSARAVKGERKAAIENYQRGINLLKDREPAIELVHLYEEAAWLYLQTGDNMLAIYASEKALRLAERLEETAAASRAHGIFGRVFGRVGDNDKARMNLERSVELARGSDQAETIVALLALGRHFELSQADARAAGDAYREALELAEQVGDLPSQVELHAAVAQLAAYRADWDQVLRSTDASTELAEREGLVSQLCLPYSLRGLLAWRDGQLDRAEHRFREAHALAEQMGWSELAFQSLFGLALVLRDRGALADAATVLGEAVEVCQRAGLAGQSVQATAMKAVVLALDGHGPQARETAAEAEELAGPLNYPIGWAASMEARGAATEDAAQGARLLAEAKARWTELERPLEAVRCGLVASQRLREVDPGEAQRLLDAAEAECERLGVPHLAERARAAVGA